MSILELYLLNVIFNLGIVCSLLFAIGSVVYVRAFFAWLEGGDNLYKKYKKASQALIATLALCLIIAILAPSKDDVMWIAGGHIVTNIEGVGELPDNAVKAANVFLESLAEKE